MLDALLVHISTSYIHIKIRSDEPQLGQYYIAEYAQQANLNVKIKKFSSHEPIVNKLKDLLQSNNCSIIGFYVDSENIWTIRRVIADIKHTLTSLFVIIGGPQVTGDAQLALKRIPYGDCAIVGEGERPFLELIRFKKFGSPLLSEIKGIAFYDGDGNFHYTGKQTPINLNSYPFPHRNIHSLDEGLAYDQISTGRGCIGNCAFCFEGSKTENILRLRSVESVIEEIDYIASNLKDRKYISFLDDTFIIHTERTIKICNHLINKYKGDLSWFCEARVDILMRNLDLLPLMKKAGLIRLQLGGESGSQFILDTYRKNMKVKDLKDVVQRIFEVGIPSVYINFIIGGAFENIDTFNETLELALELIDLAPGCAEVGCSLFSPYVGTPMRKNPSSFGITIIDPDLVRGPDGFIPFVRTKELSEQKILQLKEIFDTELRKKRFETIKKLPSDLIQKHYQLYRDLSMITDWYKQCQEIESIKNYFEAIVSWGFRSISNLSIEEIQLCVPHRTCQPTSDGERFYRVVCGDEYRLNSELQEAVFLLSAGKLSFCEIIDILKRNPKFSSYAQIDKEVFSIYQEFDKEYLIVWKCFF